MSKETGKEPAFPVTPTNIMSSTYSGVSKRLWIATQATIGLMANSLDYGIDQAVMIAYNIADEVLK